MLKIQVMVYLSYVVSYCILCCISLSLYFLCLQKWKHRSLLQVLSPDKSGLKMAVAKCSYEPEGNSAIQLVRSHKYYVLQGEDSDWWKVRDLQG